MKIYEELGLKIKKIHRGISFNEKPFMKDYIELNTKLRANAKNEFEKDFFKLMNNSVYRKTMENIQNRVDVNLVSDGKKASKLLAKPNFEKWKIFDKPQIATHGLIHQIIQKIIFLEFRVTNSDYVI